jgi:hypothetical protein
MPQRIRSHTEIQVGDYVEDCWWRPCEVTRVTDTAITARPLISGPEVRDVETEHFINSCILRKLTPDEVNDWILYGPSDIDNSGPVEVSGRSRLSAWWEGGPKERVR